MQTARRWVRFFAMVALLSIGLSRWIAPVFGILIAIAIASLIDQWLTHTPGRLLRALTRRRRSG
ncbi:MAG: hypothetical protein ABI775_00705 [Pseudonocardiales bacterium]|nr:hypothetical protein [Actinomycetota bacterium]